LLWSFAPGEYELPSLGGIGSPQGSISPVANSPCQPRTKDSQSDNPRPPCRGTDPGHCWCSGLMARWWPLAPPWVSPQRGLAFPPYQRAPEEPHPVRNREPRQFLLERSRAMPCVFSSVTFHFRFASGSFAQSEILETVRVPSSAAIGEHGIYDSK